MEELWDENGPYALAKLCDRLVPVPRDSEPPVSLYTLCRAWVRNNPALPLTADRPSPLPPLASAAGPSTSGAGTQVAQQLQEQQGLNDSQQGGLISMLPALLPPTQLETDTVAPSYPLDDFEAQEPEEALRKLKDHWVAVRQYHQAVRRAKLSRHRERLQVLLGEPSMLHAQAQAQANAQNEQTGIADMAANGALGLPHVGGMGFQGPLVLPEQAGGLAQGQVGWQPVSTADAQAALATILALGQPVTGQGPTDVAMQPHTGGVRQELPAAPSQQPLLLQIPQAGMPPPNGQGPSQPVVVPSLDVLMALQQQLSQFPQDAAHAPSQAQPPVLGQHVAAATGAAAEQGTLAQVPGPYVDAEGTNVQFPTAAAIKEEPAMLAGGSGQDGASRMDVDTVV